MGSVYYVPFENTSVSAAQDFWEITPADDRPCRILGWTLSNVGGTADAGDAQEELLRMSIVRGCTASGSLGGVGTAYPVSTKFAAAAGFTSETNNTGTAMTAGTTIWAGGMNVRIPNDFFFTPETTPYVNQGDTTLVLRLLTAPADAVSISGTIYIEEL